MKNLVYLVLLFCGIFCFSFTTKSLNKRFDKSLEAMIQELLFKPEAKNKTQAADLLAAHLHYWQMYGKKEFDIKKSEYNGYILFADPYHYGQKRISFLLGTDCSHMVHRIYQILGASYPYAKTRHFLTLSRHLIDPEKNFLDNDLSECRYQELLASFKVLNLKDEQLQSGDVIIWDKGEGINGPKGHMGIIVSKENKQFILHATKSTRLKKNGVYLQALNLDLENKFYVLRYKSKLAGFKAWDSTRNYPVDPSNCK